MLLHSDLCLLGRGVSEYCLLLLCRVFLGVLNECGLWLPARVAMRFCYHFSMISEIRILRVEERMSGY